jgi:hypothetical protein
VSNKDVKQDALDNLADALTEDILNTPDDELLREVEEDYGDPRALANKFEQILERAEKQVFGTAPSAASSKVRSSFLDLPVRWVKGIFDLGSRIPEFLSSLRPRTLAWSAAAAAVVILAQAAVITAVLVKEQGGPSGQLATPDIPPLVRMGAESGPNVTVPAPPIPPLVRMGAESGPDVAVRTPSMETSMSPGWVGNKPSDEQIAALVAAGRQLIVAGDIPNARLVLQQAADAGSAPAALTLGGTYDPTIPQAQPAGPVPNPLSDVSMSRAWYERARDLGSTEARVRLDRLTNHSSGGR